MNQYFAVCAPGIEPLTSQELAHAGLLPPEAAASAPSAGGSAFSGDLEALYRANLWLRTANRVLLRLGEFHTTAFSELAKKGGRMSWERFLQPGKPVAVRATCHKSRLYHSGAVAEAVIAAIGKRLGQTPALVKFDEEASGNLPQLVIARMNHDVCTLSIDTSGELLHRRGYRLATAKAPLRETLAAAMLAASGFEAAASGFQAAASGYEAAASGWEATASGWEATASGWEAAASGFEAAAPLLDPFCGSGTIAIEAAQMALGIPPGGKRRFAFMDWPDFDARRWQQLLDEAASGSRERPHPAPIQASDRDAGAIELAKANAERAGVSEYIEFRCQAVSAIEPAGGKGWVVTNPPYGVRVSGNKDLRNLYAQFGKVLQQKCPGWRLAILCSDPQLLGQLGIKLDTSLAWVNGGLAVRLARGVVPE
jgi:putative N6-adenine-specific DNA methylase